MKYKNIIIVIEIPYFYVLLSSLFIKSIILKDDITVYNKNKVTIKPLKNNKFFNFVNILINLWFKHF